MKRVLPALHKHEIVHKEAKLNDSLRNFLLSGSLATKHSLHGQPHERHIFVDVNFKHLMMKKIIHHEIKHHVVHAVPLTSIVTVEAGRCTQVLRQKRHLHFVADEQRCFAIISRIRELNLEVESEELRDEWRLPRPRRIGLALRVFFNLHVNMKNKLHQTEEERLSTSRSTGLGIPYFPSLSLERVGSCARLDAAGQLVAHELRSRISTITCPPKPKPITVHLLFPHVLVLLSSFLSSMYQSLFLSPFFFVYYVSFIIFTSVQMSRLESFCMYALFQKYTASVSVTVYKKGLQLKYLQENLAAVAIRSRPESDEFVFTV
eukprot:g40837.t1